MLLVLFPEGLAGVLLEEVSGALGLEFSFACHDSSVIDVGYRTFERSEVPRF